MKVSFYTLGCKVNQYETQSMREQFQKAGYEVLDGNEAADICVINTCSVTNVADRKSRQYVRRMKSLNPDAVIVVTGCYAQTDPDAVSAVDGVNIVVGTNEKSSVLRFVEDYMRKAEEYVPEQFPQGPGTETHVHKYEELKEYEDMGTITAMESRSRAFIKIEEGCDRFCSYCIIPYARGPVRSRSVSSVVNEVRHLLETGYHEIVLTGINTALYGRDLTGNSEGEGLIELLGAVSECGEDYRIRLSSLEPNVINRKTAEKMLSYEKLCSHVHLSVQSGSDSVLKRMNRHYTISQFMDITAALRSKDPDYGITTDIIVGFPGETEEEFEETLETIRRVRFSRIHVFKYSKRNHTAAAVMPDQIDGNIKNRRARILTEEAQKLTEQFYLRNKGKEREVLFEKVSSDGRYIEGYTDNYIMTYVPYDENSSKYLHCFAKVRLEKCYMDGMQGSIVSREITN